MPSIPRYEPDPPDHHRPKERTCIHCNLPFLSSWAGDRVCLKCKEPWKTLVHRKRFQQEEN